MKEFFKKLLSTETPESSKRFAALISLFSIIVLAFLAAFKDDKWITPEFMYDSLALIVGGGLGLTVIEKIFSKKNDTKQPPTQEPPQEEQK